MVRQVLTRPLVYRALGTCLLSAGIVLACALSSHIARESMEGQLAREPSYLLIASTPVFALPPATPLPTLTPTPVPTATPVPLPAIRVSIPTISLNQPIVEISPVAQRSWSGEDLWVWDVPAFAVGRHRTSGVPTQGTNIVLTGHNNMQGAVFRRLSELNVGDDILLFTADETFRYQVQEKSIVPYRGSEATAEAALQAYIAPSDTEQLTLISCWPYATNAHRIVVVAVPVPVEDTYVP